jgi:hypothetical protein
MVVAVIPETSIVPSTQSAHGNRTQAVVALYRAGIKTDRIAHVTGLSRRRVSAIVRQAIREAVRNAGVEDLRLKLFADLEEAKVGLQDTMAEEDDLLPKERVQLSGALVRLTHEQALLFGAHAPKQIRVDNALPVVNEQAAQRAREMVRFMELSDKMAAVGPGRRGLTAQEADDIIEADPEVVTPELLREYESLQVEPAPSSVPINF